MTSNKIGLAIVGGLALLGAGIACSSQGSQAAPKTPAASQAKAAPAAADSGTVKKITKTDAEWKKLLTPEQYYVLREKGTQAPFTGNYHPRNVKGVYRCAACGLDLYRSETQFDSGTGWPSFWKPIAGHVITQTDADGERTEVLCARCGGHLGHVFNDGPPPTGLRYCMNDVAMKFVPDK